MKKITRWLKRPGNIFFLFLLPVVVIYGVLDGNAEIIIISYCYLYLFGLLIGGVFYFIDKFRK